MAATPDSIRTLAKAAPMDDMKARREIYNAARELMLAVEPPYETDNRIFFAVRCFARALCRESRQLTVCNSALN